MYLVGLYILIYSNIMCFTYTTSMYLTEKLITKEESNNVLLNIEKYRVVTKLD